MFYLQFNYSHTFEFLGFYGQAEIMLRDTLRRALAPAQLGTGAKAYNRLAKINDRCGRLDGETHSAMVEFTLAWNTRCSSNANKVREYIRIDDLFQEIEKRFDYCKTIDENTSFDWDALLAQYVRGLHQLYLRRGEHGKADNVRRRYPLVFEVRSEEELESMMQSHMETSKMANRV